MRTLPYEIRIALRNLVRSPAFTAVAVASLALGIGANTAIFSLVNTVLLRPLPYREPERLVVLWENNFLRHRDRNVVSPANFLDWKARNSVFEDMALSTWASMTLTGSGTPENLSGRAVTGNLFAVLGISPALGRSFRAEEERGEPGPVPVVLSDGLWKRRFGADPGVLGRSLPTLDGTCVVVGVMPPRFRPLGSEEYWEPFAFTPRAREHRGRYAVGWARVRKGVSLEAAQNAMSAVARGLEESYPEFDAGWGIHVVPLGEEVVGDARTTLLILFSTVTLVLLIACANLASLVLSRASGRRREMAIRQALGASRGAIARQAIVESLLLCIAGGLAGVAVAAWGLDLLVAASPQEIPRLAEVRLDSSTLLFCLGVSSLVGIGFGLLAMGRDRAGDLAEGLRGAGDRATDGVRAIGLRGSLAVAQIALALVLTTSTGLVIRSLANLARVDPGFQSASLQTFRLMLPESKYSSGSRQIAFFEELAGRLRRLPGARSVGAGTSVPMGGLDVGTDFSIEGRPLPRDGEKPVADIRRIDSGYLSTLGIPLLRGRALDGRDRAGSPPVALINRTLAAQLFGSANPLGARVKVDFSPIPAGGPAEIVGVVGDVRGEGLDEQPRPTIYFADRQSPASMMTLAVRVEGDGSSLLPSIREAVRSLDPDLPLDRIFTMDQIVGRSLGQRRFPIYFLAPFSATALLLAAVGVYGLLSLSVRQRLREIGIRIALGARPKDILELIGSRAARIAGAGLCLGAAGAFAATRVLRQLLFHVSPGDPWTFAAAALAVALVSGAASVLPARRAARTDPIHVLRQE